jgi:hypothetical protein
MHYITRKQKCKGRGCHLKGWSNQKPSAKQRTSMLKKCGNKCFLGPNKSFPICAKNTCKISYQGLHAAYSRAREYETITRNKHAHTKKYTDIARKAYKLLYKN